MNGHQFVAPLICEQGITSHGRERVKVLKSWLFLLSLVGIKEMRKLCQHTLLDLGGAITMLYKDNGDVVLFAFLEQSI